MQAKSTVRRGLSLPPYLLLILPAVTFMVLMYGYPFLSSILRSFINPQGEFSFENYGKTIDLYLKDIGFTLAVTVLAPQFLQCWPFCLPSIFVFVRIRFLEPLPLCTKYPSSSPLWL